MITCDVQGSHWGPTDEHKEGSQVTLGERVDGCMDERMDEWVDVWMDR